jgi:hypothetical protein
MFLASFTSAQGTEHVDTPVRVVRASRNSNSSQSLYVDTSQDNAAVAEINENSFSDMNYEAEFWESQSAYDQGMAPFKVLNASHNNQLQVDSALLATAEYSALDIETCAEKHCLEHVL